jgi:hypothetical protein
MPVAPGRPPNDSGLASLAAPPPFASTRGVTRDEIDAAFAWLTSPFVGRAVWLNADPTAIVIRPL